MLRKNNNISMCIISDTDVATSTLPAVGSVVTSANLTAGAVVLVDLGLRRMSNTEYAALADGDQFMIVQGNGSAKPLLKTPVLTKGKVKITSKKHVASIQQQTAVGYNGTTGSLPVGNNTSYFIKIRKNDNDGANQSQPMSLFAQYKTDASGTQEELAFGLAANANRNFADEPANGYVKFEVLCDEAGAAIGAAPDTVVGSKGSREVTLTDTGSNATISAIAVGDLFRVGTATTDEVYKITATTVAGGATGTITLDRPLSQDVSLLGTTAEFITAAAAAAAEFGIRITGVEAPFDVNKFRNFYVNRFSVSFSDSDTAITHLRGAITGNGVWQQVAMDEYMTYGFEGQNEMIGVPPTSRYQFVKIPGIGANTAATSRYSVVNISWTESISGLVTVAGAQGSVVCYLNLDSAGDLDTATENVGETLATALGLTASSLDL